jgi:GAF domain-containing protein
MMLGKGFLRARQDVQDIPTNLQNEHIVQLQAQLALLKQENPELAASLEAVIKSHLADLEVSEQLFRTQEAPLHAEHERAAELAKANDALQRSLTQLTSDRNLESFLERILQEVTQIMTEGTAAQIFLYDAQLNTLSPSLGVDEQNIIRPEPGLMWGLPVGEPFPADVNGSWQRMLDLRAPLRLDVDRNADAFWPGMLEFHRSRGEQGVICTALMLGEQPLGMLGLVFRDRMEFKASEFAFFQALAQQATLAIQLTRLSEETKQAAIAREQEQAAQARAAELERINEAMRRGIERLAEAENIDTALDGFLLEAVTITNADIGGIMERVSGTEFRIRSVALDGVITAFPDSDPFGNIFRAKTARDPVGVYQKIVEGQIHCQLIDDDYAAWSPEGAAFHRQRGDRVSWLFPFRVGQVVVGYLDLTFRDRLALSQAMTETVQGLT